ncbi:hypothetical protein D3C87_2163090 [compost metagenome]
MVTCLKTKSWSPFKITMQGVSGLTVVQSWTYFVMISAPSGTGSIESPTVGNIRNVPFLGTVGRLKRGNVARNSGSA